MFHALADPRNCICLFSVHCTCQTNHKGCGGKEVTLQFQYLGGSGNDRLINPILIALRDQVD